MHKLQLNGGKEMTQDKWLDWAVRLQAIAQTGLAYGKDVYDIERFEEVRQIAAEMLVEPSGQPLEVVKELFCNESGYQTPKLDTRAAIFQDNKILLVQENDGLWSLPGGWCDVDQSVKDNVIKEVKEEAGLEVEAERVVLEHRLAGARGDLLGDGQGRVGLVGKQPEGHGAFPGAEQVGRKIAGVHGRLSPGG